MDAPFDDGLKLYTVEQAAQALTISTRYIWKAIERGDLEVIRLGRRVAIEARALREFVAERRHRAGALA